MTLWQPLPRPDNNTRGTTSQHGTERGIVLVASKAGQGEFGTRGIDGELMTLDEWPAGELLPTASCPCHQEVQTSLHEARRWLEVPRDKFVFAP